MFKKLDKMLDRFEKLNELVGDAEVIARIDEWRSYTKELAETVIAVKACGVDASVQEEILRKVTVLLGESRNALTKLKELDVKGTKLPRGEKQAKFFNKEVVPAMEALRKPIDKLEMIVEKDMWPMPSYGDMIFEV